MKPTVFWTSDPPKCPKATDNWSSLEAVQALPKEASAQGSNVANQASWKQRF